jgi:hypothetical protein
MKNIIILFSIFAVLPLWAGEETASVGKYSFTMKDNAWFMSDLPETFEIEEGYVCKYKDEIWEKWYNSGDEMLKQILDLGPNIVFKMKSSVDGQEHIFSVSEDGKPIAGVLAAGLSTGAKVGLGVGGAGAAVLIIDNANSDDEASKTKR